MPWRHDFWRERLPEVISRLPEDEVTLLETVSSLSQEYPAWMVNWQMSGKYLNAALLSIYLCFLSFLQGC
jgi:hypothetical protein